MIRGTGCRLQKGVAAVVIRQVLTSTGWLVREVSCSRTYFHGVWMHSAPSPDGWGLSVMVAISDRSILARKHPTSFLYHCHQLRPHYHISQSERNVIISLDLGTITSPKAFHKTLELGASFGDHTVVPTNPCPRTCIHISYPLNLCFITSEITASTFTVPPLAYLRNIQIHQRYRPPTHPSCRSPSSVLTSVLPVHQRPIGYQVTPRSMESKSRQIATQN